MKLDLDKKQDLSFPLHDASGESVAPVDQN